MKRITIVRPSVVAPILALIACGCGAEEEPSVAPHQSHLFPFCAPCSRRVAQTSHWPICPLSTLEINGRCPFVSHSYRPNKIDDCSTCQPCKPRPSLDGGFPTPIPPDAGDEEPEDLPPTTDAGTYISDAGSTEPVDAGVPVVDAGTTEPVDASVPVVDAGTTEPVDASVPVVDAGTTEPDAEVETPDAASDPVEPAQGPTVALRALLLTATGQEPSFGALTKFLERLGTPYDVLVASVDPILTTRSRTC